MTAPTPDQGRRGSRANAASNISKNKEAPVLDRTSNQRTYHSGAITSKGSQIPIRRFTNTDELSELNELFKRLDVNPSAMIMNEEPSPVARKLEETIKWLLLVQSHVDRTLDSITGNQPSKSCKTLLAKAAEFDEVAQEDEFVVIPSNEEVEALDGKARLYRIQRIEPSLLRFRQQVTHYLKKCHRELTALPIDDNAAVVTFRHVEQLKVKNETLLEIIARCEKKDDKADLTGDLDEDAWEVVNRRDSY